MRRIFSRKENISFSLFPAFSRLNCVVRKNTHEKIEIQNQYQIIHSQYAHTNFQWIFNFVCKFIQFSCRYYKSIFVLSLFDFACIDFCTKNFTTVIGIQTTQQRVMVRWQIPCVKTKGINNFGHAHRYFSMQLHIFYQRLYHCIGTLN